MRASTTDVRIAERLHVVLVHGLRDHERRTTLHDWAGHLELMRNDERVSRSSWWFEVWRSASRFLVFRTSGGPPTAIVPGVFLLVVALGSALFLLTSTNQFDPLGHAVTAGACATFGLVLILHPLRQPKRRLGFAAALCTFAAARYTLRTLQHILHPADYVMAIGSSIIALGLLALTCLLVTRTDQQEQEVRSVGFSLLAVGMGLIGLADGIWFLLPNDLTYRIAIFFSVAGTLFLSATIWRLRSSQVQQ